MELDEVEWGFRVRRYQQLRDQFADELPARMEEAAARRSADQGELDEIIGRFRSSHDVLEFRGAMDLWSRKNLYYGFSGPNGAMFLGQLINDATSAAGRAP